MPGQTNQNMELSTEVEINEGRTGKQIRHIINSSIDHSPDLFYKNAFLKYVQSFHAAFKL